MHRPHCSTLILLASTAALIACGGDDETPPAADSARTAAVAPGPCSGATTPSLTMTGVGPVRVGDAISDVPAECAAGDTTFALEGTTEQGKIIRFGPHTVTALTTGPGDSTISRIIVRDSAFRTQRGVGVGSRVGALRDAYGQLCAMQGEGRVVMLAAALPGISFATSLSPSALPNGGRGLDADPSIVPDSTRISALWIYEGATTCGGS